MKKARRASATGLIWSRNGSYGFGVWALGSGASAPAGLWCFLAFFSGLASAAGAEASVDGSEAVAELGVPLALASAAGSWAGVAAGSVP